MSCGGRRQTGVSLFDQGLVQVLQAAVTGLEPRASYELGLSAKSDGADDLGAAVQVQDTPTDLEWRDGHASRRRRPNRRASSE